MVPSRVLFPLLAALAARPAAAGSILYVSAATPGRIEGYCLAADGSPASDPAVRIDTRRGQDPSQAQPRRLVVDTRVREGEETSVLYVAEIDRVEAFRIGRGGGLAWIGETRVDPEMRMVDILVSADGAWLYVPHAGRNRIVAYPLDGRGAPAPDFTSCVQETPGSGLRRLVVNGSLLYVTATNPGRIDVFRLMPDGSLPLLPVSREHCTEPDPERTEPVPMWTSTRRGLGSPTAMVLKDGVLYVEQRSRARISAFRLSPDGNFADPVPVKPGSKKKKYQRPLSSTAPGFAYEVLATHGQTILATAFGPGRVDAFALRPDGRIRTQPAVTSKADLRTSPVGATVHGGVLYVAAGAFDRVTAYRLRPNGRLADVNPFARTGEQRDSFPNDVAVAMLPEGCE